MVVEEEEEEEEVIVVNFGGSVIQLRESKNPL